MDESNLPICMQQGWDPQTPGREYANRVLLAAEQAQAEGDLDERDRLLALIEEN